MGLPQGHRLGSYEIVSSLGAGGMGEVYLARDSRLQRDVAVKVLPDVFAGDAERVARFEREARTLAALNHPNIAQVYGLEESATGDGRRVRALVMELVGGSTLADRLIEGPLALPEALAIARQVIDGLEAAHERGIVHRDLKPANLMVTADGQVKILDFGLAKAGTGGTSSSARDVSLSPTMTSPAMTSAGVILGTAAYMSPEQAKGQDADKRADVWAFGCVFYEMLAGRRAFTGDDVAELLASVLKSSPDWNALPRETPTAVRTILRRCLEKERKARIPDISVVRYQLADGDAQEATTDVATAPARLARRERAIWMALVLACALGASGLAAREWLRAPAVSPLVRFEIFPPDGARFTGANNTPRMAVSPDGRMVVFAVSLRDGTPDQLWIRRFDALEATRFVAVTDRTGEPVQQPFWSPDGDYVGFFVANSLRTVQVSTGVTQTLCDVPGNNYSAAWGPDGTILFGSSETRGIQRVSVTGGAPTPVTRLDASASESWHGWPRFLPDGRFLYMAAGSTDTRTIFAGSLDSEARTRVLDTPFMVEFAPPDLLLFVKSGPLLAQRFNTRTLTLEGAPFTVVPGVQGNISNGRAAFSTSNTGTLVFRPGDSSVTRDSQLAWFDRSGRMTGLVGKPERIRGLELSPDGSKAAVHLDSEINAGDIWVYDLERGAQSRLTLDATAHSLSPAWSPDGRRVLFGRVGKEPVSVFEKDAAGVGEERPVVAAPSTAVWPLSVGPDGKTIVLGKTTFGLAFFDGVRLLDVGVPPRRPFLAQLSPNGRWLAYDSNESGPEEVYVTSFPSPSTRYQVSTQGGFEPRWRRDGRELFYRTRGRATAGSPKLMAVGVREAQSALQFSAPAGLFDLGTNAAEHRAPYYSYDVAADGQRFLLSRPYAEAPRAEASRPLVVVLNWNASAR